MFGEQEVWIESRLKRSTLEYIGEDSNNEPKDDYSPYEPGSLLEHKSAENATI